MAPLSARESQYAATQCPGCAAPWEHELTTESRYGTCLGVRPAFSAVAHVEGPRIIRPEPADMCTDDGAFNRADRNSYSALCGLAHCRTMWHLTLSDGRTHGDGHQLPGYVQCSRQLSGPIRTHVDGSRHRHRHRHRQGYFILTPSGSGKSYYVKASADSRMDRR